MKIGKYLKFHFDCLESGVLPSDGLCNSLLGNSIQLFEPTDLDFKRLFKEGLPVAYWGCGCRYGSLYERAYKYTPLRQTIVLFLAAMNGEL